MLYVMALENAEPSVTLAYVLGICKSRDDLRSSPTRGKLLGKLTTLQFMKNTQIEPHVGWDIATVSMFVFPSNPNSNIEILSLKLGMLGGGDLRI